HRGSGERLPRADGHRSRAGPSPAGGRVRIDRGGARMSLVRAELRRLVKRRFTRYMLLIGVLVLAAVAVGTFFSHQKIGPAQMAAAERSAEREYQLQVQFSQQFRDGW